MRSQHLSLALAALACMTMGCSEPRVPFSPLRANAPPAPQSANGYAPVPISGEAILSGLCSFDVGLEQSGMSKILFAGRDRGVTLFLSPTLEARLTNETTGKQITLGITGVFHTYAADSKGDLLTVVTGRNLLFDPVAGFVLAEGVFRFAFNGDVLVEPLNGHGTLTDVCELLS